jgi:hypothetical protein
MTRGCVSGTVGGEKCRASDAGETRKGTLSVSRVLYSYKRLNCRYAKATGFFQAHISS